VVDKIARQEMKVIIEIGHPAHVHHFKNTIWNLEKKGCEVKIVSKDKDIALYLLNIYGFKYEKLGRNYSNLVGKAYGLIKTDYILFKIAKKFNSDIFVSRGSPYIAHVSKLLNKPHIAFCDTEHAKLNDMLAYPFTDVICTPTCFKKDLGKKQVRYNGYHELAYLHPNYFEPDSSVLDDLGLSKNDKFTVLRFVSWDASHDIGQQGLDLKSKQQYIRELEKYGEVFITSEAKLEKELNKYKLRISPEKIHDLLHYATLYVGEGATMATEAGILGTPSIYISSLAGTMGNFEELENRYGLVYSFRNPDIALEKALQILKDEKVKTKWQNKRKKLLDEKIDVTKFMTEFIENYPENQEMFR